MITQATIYKHLGKWTGSDQPLYQHLLYFHDGVAATDTHQAIFIPQQNSSCKIETANGEPGDVVIPVIDQQQGYTDLEKWMNGPIRHKFTRIKPIPNNILWSGDIVTPIPCLKEWKSTLELLRRLSRKRSRSGSETPVILAKEGTNLVAYVYKSQYCSAKFYLCTDLPTPKDEMDTQWSGTFNVEFLYNFVDLMLEINAPAITMSITIDSNPLLLLESQEIWAVSTCYNLSADFMLEDLERFYHVANIPVRSPISGGAESGVLV